MSFAINYTFVATSEIDSIEFFIKKGQKINKNRVQFSYNNRKGEDAKSPPLQDVWALHTPQTNVNAKLHAYP